MDSLSPGAVVLRDYDAAPPRARRAGPRPVTTCLVAAFHAGAIAAALLIFPSKPPTPAPAISIPVIFEPAASSVPAQETLSNAAIPVPVLTHLDTLAAPPAVFLPASTGALAARPRARRTTPAGAPTRARSTPNSMPDTVSPAAPAVPAHAAPTPTAAVASPGLLAAWEARIHQAVQNALAYPNVARLMHREGRTRIRFDYEDGSVARVSVVETSTLAALDRAAVDAVTRAAIPAPPREIAGQNRTLLLWVTFTLSGEDQ